MTTNVCSQIKSSILMTYYYLLLNYTTNKKHKSVQFGMNFTCLFNDYQSTSALFWFQNCDINVREYTILK